MDEVLDKFLLTVKEHKTKTISGAIFVGLCSVLRYMQSSGKIKKVLSKMTEKLEKRLEEKIREQEKLLKLMAHFEETYNHFMSLNQGIKRNLKRDIDLIFDIEGLRESLKTTKSFSEEERTVLWDDFKSEIFLHAIFSIVYITISKVVLFIRQCILNKHEGLLEGESEKNLQTLENFFSDFSEFIIRNAGKVLYQYLKARLEPILSKIHLKEAYGEEELTELFTNICDIITEVEEDNTKIKPFMQDNTDTPFGSHMFFEEAAGDSTFIDVNGIGSLLREETEVEKKKVVKEHQHITKEKGEIKFNLPQFRIRILRAFTKTTDGHRVVENLDDFLKYFYAGKESMSVLKGIEELEEEEDEEEEKAAEVNNLAGTSRKSSIYVKKNGVLVIDLEEDEENIKEHQASTEEKSEESEKTSVKINGDERNKILKVIKNASDEFLDLIECGNFNLYGLYAINYEFRKLINRIMIYFTKKHQEGEKIVLAKFLPVLHKLVEEIFIDENAEQLNDAFYSTKIKSAMKIIQNKEVSAQEMFISCKIMEEFEMKKQIEASFKEFGKRIYLDSEYARVTEMSQKKSNGKEVKQKEVAK